MNVYMSKNSYSIYKQVLIDHYRSPRNFGVISEPTNSAEEVNASCGDETELTMIVRDGVVEKCLHKSRGCAISVAAASLLSVYITGMSVDEILLIDEEDMLNLLHLPELSGRIKCATLPLEAVKRALETKE